jgi:hypothetical protein
VHTAEIEKRHVQVNGSGQMFQRLAESKAKAREAAEVRPHAEVGPLDMGSADSFQLGVSADWYWHRCDNFGGVVPLRPFGVGFPVDFQQLSEVNVRAEILFDCVPVDAEPIGGHLESASNALAQIAHKFDTVGSIAFPDVVGQNHFRFGVNRHPNVLVAPLLRHVTVKVSFLSVDKGPEFIGLHESRANIPHLRIEKIAGFVSDSDKQRENRALVCTSGAGDGADAHSFKQKRDDLRGPVRRDVMPSQRLLARLGERGLANGAAITLNLEASVGSESFCFGVFAADACHIGFSLVFLREKPDNHDLGSECGLRPRLDSASPLAETSGEALPANSLLWPVVSGQWSLFFGRYFCKYLLSRRRLVKPRESENPTVRGDAVNHDSFDIARLESLNRCIYRRERIGAVLAEIEACLHQLVSHLGGGEIGFPLRRELQNFSDSIGQTGDFGSQFCSFRLEFHSLVFGEHVHRGIDKLTQFNDFGLDLLFLSRESDELLQRTDKKELVFVYIKHTRSIDTMPINSQGQNKTKSKKEREVELGWDRAIADAKEQIRRLEISISIFQEHRDAGEPWPESATQI